MSTQKIKGTIFPLWYESIKMNVDLPTNLSTAPDIHVTVWDWDAIGSNVQIRKVTQCRISWEDSKFPWRISLPNSQRFPSGIPSILTHPTSPKEKCWLLFNC